MEGIAAIVEVKTSRNINGEYYLTYQESKVSFSGLASLKNLTFGTRNVIYYFDNDRTSM